MKKKKLFKIFAAAVFLGVSGTYAQVNPAYAATTTSKAKAAPSVQLVVKKNAPIYTVKYNKKTGKITSLKRVPNAGVRRGAKLKTFFYLKKGKTKYYFLGVDSNLKKSLAIKASYAKAKKVPSLPAYLKVVSTPTKVTVDIPKYTKVVNGKVKDASYYYAISQVADGKAKLTKSTDQIPANQEITIAGQTNLPLQDTQGNNVNLPMYIFLIPRQDNLVPAIAFIPQSVVTLSDANAQVPTMEQFNSDYGAWQKEVAEIIKNAQAQVQANK